MGEPRELRESSTHRYSFATGCLGLQQTNQTTPGGIERAFEELSSKTLPRHACQRGQQQVSGIEARFNMELTEHNTASVWAFLLEKTSLRSSGCEDGGDADNERLGRVLPIGSPLEVQVRIVRMGRLGFSVEKVCDSTQFRVAR
jgi:hypothetical protein